MKIAGRIFRNLPFLFVVNKCTWCLHCSDISGPKSVPLNATSISVAPHPSLVRAKALVISDCSLSSILHPLLFSSCPFLNLLYNCSTSVLIISRENNVSILVPSASILPLYIHPPQLLEGPTSQMQTSHSLCSKTLCDIFFVLYMLKPKLSSLAF